MTPKHTAHAESFSWRAPEFLYRKKTILWYTHVSVFFFIALLALFLIHNWLGVAIVLALFWLFLAKANDHPRVIDYAVGPEGITHDERVINYSSIASFSVD